MINALWSGTSAADDRTTHVSVVHLGQQDSSSKFRARVGKKALPSPWACPRALGNSFLGMLFIPKDKLFVFS